MVTNRRDKDGRRMYYYNEKRQAIEVRDGSEGRLCKIVNSVSYVDEGAIRDARLSHLL